MFTLVCLLAISTVAELPPVAISSAPPAELDLKMSALFRERGVTTAGVAAIEDGRVSWTGYYGERAPGEAASSRTMFNVGSMTKPVVAETILRLASSGRISLDEPMSKHWVDPDLVGDGRHQKLTPRLALSHRTGLPNWRRGTEDGKLAFIATPGTTFGYSGEGYDYVATFAEEKLGRDFESLVAEYVFEPIGMQHVSLSRRADVLPRVPKPIGEDGTVYEPLCYPSGWCPPEGYWSAADDLVVTVEDYAAFLIAVMKGEGLGDELDAERQRLHTSTADDPVLACPFEDPERCPTEQGYGLGWEILRFGDETIVMHGGTDWSERTLGYFYPRSRKGFIIFLNAPGQRANEALIEAIELLDAGSPLPDLFRGWAAKHATLSGGDG